MTNPTNGETPERAPKIHTLKTWPPFFAAVRDGTKPFEIRKTDRDFEVGDTLVLQEFDPVTEAYTGEMVSRKITYMADWGQPLGQAVLGIAPLEDWQSRALSAERERDAARAENAVMRQTLKVLQMDYSHAWPNEGENTKLHRNMLLLAIKCSLTTAGSDILAERDELKRQVEGLRLLLTRSQNYVALVDNEKASSLWYQIGDTLAQKGNQ